MKQTVSRALLWFAVIWWGVWFGGQTFNALMVVPHFSADLPQSLEEWGALLGSDHVADFVRIFSPLWIAAALGGSLALGWSSYGRGRNWAVGSLFASLVSAVMLMAWMNPTLSQVLNAQDVTISLRQVQATLHQWTIVNWARLVIEFDGFVCALLALSSPGAHSDS